MYQYHNYLFNKYMYALSLQKEIKQKSMKILLHLHALYLETLTFVTLDVCCNLEYVRLFGMISEIYQIQVLNASTSSQCCCCHYRGKNNKNTILDIVCDDF